MDYFRHSHIAVGHTEIHVVEAGSSSARPYVFLHGWPQSWLSWAKVMALASTDVYAIAIDLPGIGESTGGDGRAVNVAGTIHSLVAAMGLIDPVLVGHDFGGMVTYAYLREYSDVAAAVIVDVALPGVPPWDSVVRNPHLWHFGFHSVPRVPEALVQGRQLPYFNYFFDAVSAKPESIDDASRAAYAAAYSSPSSLRTGFDWYRAFPDNVRDNIAYAAGPVAETPLLYVRGASGYSSPEPYVEGLRDAGIASVTGAVVADSGHFVPDENPAGLWAAIREYCNSVD